MGKLIKDAKKTGDVNNSTPSVEEWQRHKETLLNDPLFNLEKDYVSIYQKKNYTLGWPPNLLPIFHQLSRPNTFAVIGAQLGDEGKGRIVDNIISTLTKNKNIQTIYVIRTQGGSNAGHTVDNGVHKIALHQIPSMVFEKKAIGIMESLMCVNVPDLQTEYELVESIIGKNMLSGRLFLSRDALLNTDLDRAQEVLEEIKKGGKNSGSTKRGIGPTYGDFYARKGLFIKNLLDQNWEVELTRKYTELEKEIALYSMKLSDITVPDYEALVQKKGTIRNVGSLYEFIQRLAQARAWLIRKKLVIDTVLKERTVRAETAQGIAGVVFEMAQAVGLHPSLGTSPDTTSSDTTPYGILYSTKNWSITDIANRIGIIKVPYMSSVGRRHMPTEVPLQKDDSLSVNPSADEQWALWVRKDAHEYGTSTGRPRDICHFDIPFLSYNCFVGNIEKLAVTHLDVARKEQQIRVCTHYKDKKTGNVSLYQPGLEYLEQMEPQYITLPGWDGEQVQKAKKFEDLPEEAKQFLAFIQTRIGVPIVLATTGYKREHILEIPYTSR